MSKHQDLQRVLDCGIVAIIRANSGEQLVKVARALYEGGVDVIEVTFTVPNVLEILQAVRKDLGDKILLGAGTVLDSETCRAALLAGAEFIVSPTVNLEVIKMCNRYDKLMMPGAFTPTEVLTAWENGGDIIKIFPGEIGGPNYLKALHGPLPQVRIMPTGGVDLETLPSFFKAGACAVGVGGNLVEKKAVEAGDMDRIRTLAQQYSTLVKQCQGNK